MHRNRGPTYKRTRGLLCVGIADVFTQLDLMEKRGSGFQKITTHTSELRLYSKDLAPTFESDASSFFTTVYSVLYGKTDADFQRIIDQESAENNKPEETSPKAIQNTNPKGEKANPKTSPKTTPKTSPKLPRKPLGKTAQTILDLLSEDPYMKREDLMAKLDLSLAGVKYQLANLQKEKYLLRIEGRKSGRWKVLIKK